MGSFVTILVGVLKVKFLSTIILISTLATGQSAFAKVKKVRVIKGTQAPSSETTSDEADQKRLAATDSTSTDARINTTPQKITREGKYHYITDGGNPAPGALLISPMVGQYALTGFEAGIKTSVMVANHAFVPALNNSISVEAEVFKGTWHGIFGKNESLFYGASGRWDFHIVPKWTVYGAAGLQMEQLQTIADMETSEQELSATLQIGGMLILKDNFRLRGEFDYAHASYRFGIVYAL